jgi:hypothetical protein
MIPEPDTISRQRESEIALKPEIDNSATLPASPPVKIDTPAVNQVETIIDTSSARESTSMVIAETPPDPNAADEALKGSRPPVPQTETPEQASPLFTVFLFAIVFALLAWALSLNREVLRKIYRAALNENLSSLLYREQRFATTQYLYYTIYIIFFINAGLFLYFLGREFEWTTWTLTSIWSCIVLVVVVYMLRHLSMSILGHTYPITKEMTHFSFSILLHNILLGIALIPVNLFLAFGPDGLHRTIAITGAVICCLIYIMRQFRGLLIAGSAITSHPFHFFVYLCAVEILPLFTLVTFFHN